MRASHRVCLVMDTGWGGVDTGGGGGGGGGGGLTGVDMSFNADA